MSVVEDRPKMSKKLQACNKKLSYFR